MPKPSERIREIYLKVWPNTENKLDAIISYLDEEYEKKDEVVLTAKKEQLSEFEAIKKEIGKQAIKEFAEKIMKRGIKHTIPGLCVCDLIYTEAIKEVLAEYNINI